MMYHRLSSYRLLRGEDGKEQEHLLPEVLKAVQQGFQDIQESF